ncbi:hypothetical protein [Hydrogenothermus marinus]|uniref:Copper resistance protein D n=1 Tax=Hydrogenothermus marinus TaxID=133270 RepID=A0A3M0B7P0_9AQUI|nr:hypothetical protein [Hydrogenothermus marinus]RMA93161.1 hypothetical protein CLV39_1496 [Hydrogenothermus marinus]
MINAILEWLHIIAVLIWIGGMFYTLFILKPTLSILEDKKAKFMEKIMDKFFPFVWVSIILLFITGGVKAKYFIHYPLFNLKLFIYFIMIIVFSYIYFGLYKKLKTTENKAIYF